MSEPAKLNNNTKIPFKALSVNDLFFFTDPNTGQGYKNFINTLIATIEANIGVSVRSNLNVSGATITLDMQSANMVYFFGTSTIDEVKTWETDNDSDTLEFYTRVDFDGSYAQTFPANWKMQSFIGDWVDGTKIWTPPAAGTYEIIGHYDGAVWNIKIFGPF